MKLTPGAIYETLVLDLDYTLGRDTTYDGESVLLDVKKYAAQYLKDKFLSKLVPSDTSEADVNAYQAFASSNERCRTWSLPELSESDVQLVGEFAKILEDFFLVDLGADVELSWANIALNGRCGPGAAVGASGTSWYSKMYSGVLTASDQALVDLYYADISMWPEESNAESIRAETFGSIRTVGGSRSSFVPKTTKTSRMISVEPTLNTFYQLGLGSILEKRIKRFFGIDLATQPAINRWLAYIGSSTDATLGDGFATIDLSSASDSISLQFGSRFIPAEWFSTILSLRSPRTTIELNGSKSEVKLYMVSTMGNGFTFPLQTAIFSSIASACVSLSDGIRQHPRGFGAVPFRAGSFSVFGDDIVVPCAVYERTLRLLRILGFIPNPEKCFGSGSFRESCGHDYYRGHNVRPVFLRKLETETDVTVLTNLLVAWSARLGVPLTNTLELLITSQKWHVVPMGESEDAGLRVPFVIARDLGIRKDPGTQSYAYHRQVAQSRRLRILDDRIATVAGVKRQIYNPFGLLISFLRGEVRNRAISFRNWSPVYRTKRGISPYWDYAAPSLEASLIGGVESSPALAARYAWIFFPLVKELRKSLRKRSSSKRR